MQYNANCLTQNGYLFRFIPLFILFIYLKRTYVFDKESKTKEYRAYFNMYHVSYDIVGYIGYRDRNSLRCSEVKLNIKLYKLWYCVYDYLCLCHMHL
jgi:hypothetical protein